MKTLYLPTKDLELPSTPVDFSRRLCLQVRVDCSGLECDNCILTYDPKSEDKESKAEAKVIESGEFILEYWYD